MTLNPIIKANHQGTFELAMHVRNATWAREFCQAVRWSTPGAARDHNQECARKYAGYAREYYAEWVQAMTRIADPVSADSGWPIS